MITNQPTFQQIMRTKVDEARIALIEKEEEQQTDLCTSDWDDVVRRFEDRLTEYCCPADHTVPLKVSESGLWEVTVHSLDYDCREYEYRKCVCSTNDIAVEEAVEILYHSNGPFFESDDIFDNDISEIARENGATEKLESMQQTMRNIVQCVDCYQNLSGERFNRQSGGIKVLVGPYTPPAVITKSRRRH